MFLTATERNSNLTMLSEKVASGLGNSFSKGDKTPLSTVVFLYLSKSIKALIRFNFFMVGVVGSRKACRTLCPVYRPATFTARSLVTSSGGLKTTAKELVMSQHNYTQDHTKKNQLTLSVSEIKKQSLQKQLEIISHALTIFCLDSSKINKDLLKNPALELVRLLDEIEHDNQRKTSRFNVLAKGSKNLIAERVTFNQATQYPDSVIKFAGMVGGVS